MTERFSVPVSGANCFQVLPGSADQTYYRAMSMHRISSVLALGLLASSFGSGPAVAATAVASFGVTATVQASCRASLMPDRAATMGAASAASVACSHPVSYTVSVSAERSAGTTPVSLETGVFDPSVARSANSLNRHPVSTNKAIDTEDDSTQDLTIAGRTAESRSWTSSANTGSIVVTVTY
jgi:hypothetical protein